MKFYFLCWPTEIVFVILLSTFSLLSCSNKESTKSPSFENKKVIQDTIIIQNPDELDSLKKIAVSNYIDSNPNPDELDSLKKIVVSNYIDSNPRDFVAQKNLINVFTKALNNIEKGIVDRSNIKLVEYVQNGGKIVDLYKSELEKLYKGELLDELVRRFKENPLFKDADKIIGAVEL
jgi:PBP1b-binding outer membrane lipoprotein LpoB